MMQLGAETVFVGSGIFKSSNPKAFARAIVDATTHYNDPERLAEYSMGLGDAMFSLDVRTLPEAELMSTREDGNAPDLSRIAEQSRATIRAPLCRAPNRCALLAAPSPDVRSALTLKTTIECGIRHRALSRC